MMDKLFPEFNEHESAVASVLTSKRKAEVAEALRLITNYASEN
jgi:hypothetical protein